MKGFKLTILVLSVLLLTISSGLLFYKNLFLLDGPNSGGKVDFEELRFIDLKANATVALMRKNLSVETSAITAEATRLKELLNIITDINKGTPELKNSIKKIQDHFTKKIRSMEEFSEANKDLRFAVDSLTPGYNELTKNKITFTVDKKDFYKEAVLDSYMYVSVPTRENANRVNDDVKILSQIVSYANTPNPVIKKFSKSVEIVAARTKQIEELIEILNEDGSIATEMNTVGQYYKEAQDSKARDGEIFLSMVFAAIVLYLGCVVFIIKKLT